MDCQIQFWLAFRTSWSLLHKGHEQGDSSLVPDAPGELVWAQ